MLPSKISGDPCGLADRWMLDPRFAEKLVELERKAAKQFGRYWPGLYIFSGYRTPAHNRDVGGVEGSFHTHCPAIAADLRVGNVRGIESDEVKAILGGMWRLMGGRWGGTFAEPSPNHFDIGGI